MERKKYYLCPEKKVPSIFCQSVWPDRWPDKKSEDTAWSPLLLCRDVFCSDLNTIKIEGVLKLFLKRVEFKTVKNQGKVGKIG